MTRRYRYRTSVLVGQWRRTREQAAQDAVTAKQARRESHGPDRLQWIVPGTIEERETSDRPA